MNPIWVFVAIAAMSCIVDARELVGFTKLGPIPNADGTFNANKAVQAFYFVSSTTSTWAEALNMCRLQRGMLAAPMNPVENAALRAYLINQNFNAHLWIGARRTATAGASWRWESTVEPLPLMFTDWLQPNCGTQAGEMCAYMYGDGNKWCSKHCSGVTYFVCEA